MRAAQLQQFGSKDAIKIVDDAPKPTVTPNQVLVEVYAASVNPFDIKVRDGSVKNLVLPAIIGGDFAGIVSEVGSDVSDIQIGDRVYGQADALSGHGSFADYTPVDVSSLADMPARVDFDTAAAIPLTATSAYQALVDTLHLVKGQRILIHGGAGGIGGFAIQLAKHLGAHVATTASAKDIDYAHELGADEVVNYQSEKFEQKLSDFDAVFDTIGGDTYRRSFKVLKAGGMVVSMLEQPNESLMSQYGVTATHQFTRSTAERLRHIAELVDQGVIKVSIDKIFPLADTVEALEYLHASHHRGKVVIHIKG